MMGTENGNTNREDALIQAAFDQEQSGAPSQLSRQEGDATLAKDSSPHGKVARALPHIEGYKIQGVLGEGGMSIVYRAVQLKLDRAVALKFLPAVVVHANPAAVARFRREATAAAKFHHTNIVPVYDFGDCRDGYYYAMELIAGQPLNVLIRRLAEQNLIEASPVRLAEILKSATSSGSDIVLPPQSDGSLEVASTGSTGSSTVGRGRAYFVQVARWMADAADALAYAHDQGVIHRDIKPSNLLLSQDGRIMIADFGLAKLAGDRSVTLTGSLVGTLRYMSPEQAMAKRMRVDHRTDLYSLGATMYELLCFQPAFPGSDDKEVLGAIITRDPAPPRRVVSSVPAELETICLTLLEKSPDSRYATARALAEDLRRFLSDMPIVKKRPGPIRRVRKFIRRHKAGTLASLSVLGLAATIFLAVHVSNRSWVKGRLDSALGHENAGDHAAAASVYQEILSHFPRSPEALTNLARMKKELYNQQREAGQTPDPQLLEDALSLCDRALAVEPGDVSLLNTKGVILKILGRYGEAISAYERVLRINADFSAAWENLGIVHALDKNLLAAEEKLRRAAELCDESQEQCEYPWRNLAAVQLQRAALSAPREPALDAQGQGSLRAQSEPRPPALYAERQGSGSGPLKGTEGRRHEGTKGQSEPVAAGQGPARGQGLSNAAHSLENALRLSPQEPATQRLHLKLLLESLPTPSPSKGEGWGEGDPPSPSKAEGDQGGSLKGRGEADSGVDWDALFEIAIHADKLAEEKDPVVKRLRALACLARGEKDAAARHARAAIELNDPLAAADHLILAIHAARKDVGRALPADPEPREPALDAQRQGAGSGPLEGTKGIGTATGMERSNLKDADAQTSKRQNVETSEDEGTEDRRHEGTKGQSEPVAIATGRGGDLPAESAPRGLPRAHSPADPARQSLAHAESAWPADLRAPDAYRVTADAGILWFESASVLFTLKDQAEQALAGLPREGQ